MIRKKELRQLLDRLVITEKNGCDGTHGKIMWLNGSLEIIYLIAGYFGIELYDIKKDGDSDGKAD